jgi:hypothetical protein
MLIKNQINGLFCKLLLLFGIVSIFDFTIGKTLEHFYFSQTSGNLYRTTYSLDSTKADILIFGSSRANHHYDTQVIADSLGMSCYNTGRDGNFLLYNYAIFKTIVNRYTPKIVILDVNKNELSSNATEYERLSALLPYKNRNSAIEQTISLKGPYEKIKCLSKIYPYNSMLLTIAIGNTKLNQKRHKDVNGYIPLNGFWNHKNNEPSEPDDFKKIDKNKDKAIREIIEDCRAKGIRLLLVHSPILVQSMRSNSIDPIQEIANTYKVEFLDFSSNADFSNNNRLFVNPTHLNAIGAKHFSEILVEYLLKNPSFPSNSFYKRHDYSVN